MELYKKHRPKNLSEVVGQVTAVKSLSKMLEGKQLPHTLLLTGPSGCGKTSIARILKKELNCSRQDFNEINCADAGIDMVREIRSRMNMAPLGGACRIWYLDECQALSRAGFAQQSMLKILEDTPSHVYFILAATDPSKLIKTIHTRCTEIKLGLLTYKNLLLLVKKVADAEEIAVPQSVLEKSAEMAEGSARKALVLLDQVIGLEDEEDMLQTLSSADIKHVAFDIVKALLWERPKWNTLAAIIKEVDDEPENIRRLVMAVAETEILKGGKNTERCFLILSVFEDPIFDTGRSGRAKLTRMLFEVFSNAKK